MRDVAPGLWLWRQPHPAWEEGNDWEPEVASFAVESAGVALLLDPLAPPPGAREVWERIEALQPSVVVVVKPDHVRDVDLFVRWYGASAYGPFLYWRDDVPQTELRAVHPGHDLPGGLRAPHHGRGLMEPPRYLPQPPAPNSSTQQASPRGKRRPSVIVAAAPPDRRPIAPATSGSPAPSAPTADTSPNSCPSSQRTWSISWTAMSIAIPPLCARKPGG